MKYKDFIENFQEPYFSSFLNLANVTLIFFTVLVGYLSWKTAKKASEIKLLPLLAIYFRGGPLKNTQVILRNIGSTPAYDIKIDNYVHIITDVQQIWRLEMGVPATNVVIPNEKKILKLKATSNGEKSSVGDFMVFHLDPRQDHSRKGVGLFLTFKNLQGRVFYSKITTGKSGLFIEPARRLNWFGKVYLSLNSIQSFCLMAFYKLLWKFKKPYIAQSKDSDRK